MSDYFSLSGNSDPGAALDRHQYHNNNNNNNNNKPQSTDTLFSTTSSPEFTSTPHTLLSRRTTITKHLKRHWTLDDSTSSSVRRLFTSEQLLKERKALGVWRNTLHGYLLDPAFKVPTPRHTHDSPRLAYCIVSELLATEETYLGHLSVLKQMFIDPFLQTFQNRYMIRDLQTIFSYIPQLIILSTSLVRRWCMSIEQQTCCINGKIVAKDTKHDIGKTFCDLEDEFKVYTYYAVHYAKAQKCISRMEQKPIYQQWMHSVLQKKEIKRMGLSDYLIAPIQRITRYCLLVKDLMKHTDGHDIELERALKYLTALAVAMNNCQQ
ncbi:Dbl homology domain-containing protein [Absidia repens]|uniref:Dbl homology domain-containing protein n=1 Tax=Absidia repens TaxID=90262 RepID=A0A1X2IAN0_9FUNG|nr:Dbl homology domain-containing protein [Absidia repens]